MTRPTVIDPVGLAVASVPVENDGHIITRGGIARICIAIDVFKNVAGDITRASCRGCGRQGGNLCLTQHTVEDAGIIDVALPGTQVAIWISADS